jgi:DNA helicase MCM8
MARGGRRVVPGEGGDVDDENDDVDSDAEPSGARVILSPGARARRDAHRPSEAQNCINGGPPLPTPALRASWRGADGWAAYFPDETEADESCRGRVVVVNKLREFFVTEAGRALLASVPESTFALPLNYDAITRPTAPPALRGIAAVIPASPEEALPCIGLAASRAAEQLCEIADAEPLPVSHEHRLWPRVYKYGPLTSLRSLKGNSVGKFVSVYGTVVRVSNIRQQVTSMHFECGKCGEIFLCNFPDYKFSPPTTCPTDRCRSRAFVPRRETAETVDWQKIRVQEIIEQEDDATMREEGRMPRTIDAELFSDLIDSCIPGDTVKMCGIVRVLSVDVPGGGGSGGGGSSKATKAGKCLFYLYIEANSTTTSRKAKQNQTSVSLVPDVGAIDAEAAAIHQVIREVVREADPFAFLVHSSVPSIYGHELG